MQVASILIWHCFRVLKYKIIFAKDVFNMIKSMTGFGRGEYEQDQKKFLVEIKTVNHRYNDIYIKLPKQIQYLENKVRDMLRNQLVRGKIDVFISYEDNSENPVNVLPDKALISGYMKALETIRDEFGVADDITLTLISKFPDVFRVEKREIDESRLWEILSEAVKRAVEATLDMRRQEGYETHKNLMEKTKKVMDELEKIKASAPLVVCSYREKLASRINELLQNQSVDESRIETEVALFADRCCIDEEIVRFESHVKQFINTMELDGPVGKKLDFIIQEMNREANTMGSKANDLDIIKSVVEIKYEIEKMRELVQNIE
jgi:uncharacterized protein (TIGR00255 family)